jgi:hypothetical protein
VKQVFDWQGFPPGGRNASLNPTAHVIHHRQFIGAPLAVDMGNSYIPTIHLSLQGHPVVSTGQNFSVTNQKSCRGVGPTLQDSRRIKTSDPTPQSVTTLECRLIKGLMEMPSKRDKKATGPSEWWLGA